MYHVAAQKVKNICDISQICVMQFCHLLTNKSGYNLCYDLYLLIIFNLR